MDNTHPILGFLKRVFLAFIIIGIPIVYIAATLLLPDLLKARRNASDSTERTYWTYLLVSFSTTTYAGTTALLLLIFWWVDIPAVNYWPTLSGILGIAKSPGSQLIVDMMVYAFVIIFCALRSSWFGSHDTNMNYIPPSGNNARSHLADVDQRLHEASQGRPSLDPRYAHLSDKEKYFLDANWRKQYDEAVRRHKNVHEMYHQ
jgi:hypothetical protein